MATKAATQVTAQRNFGFWIGDFGFKSEIEDLKPEI
jgi:hypothetical protein